MKKNLLISKMKLYDETQAILANIIGLSTQRLNAKINGTNGAEFTQSEMFKIKNHYNLTNDEFNAIFFTEKAS